MLGAETQWFAILFSFRLLKRASLRRQPSGKGNKSDHDNAAGVSRLIGRTTARHLNQATRGLILLVCWFTMILFARLNSAQTCRFMKKNEGMPVSYNALLARVTNLASDNPFRLSTPGDPISWVMM